MHNHPFQTFRSLISAALLLPLSTGLACSNQGGGQSQALPTDQRSVQTGIGPGATAVIITPPSEEATAPTPPETGTASSVTDLKPSAGAEADQTLRQRAERQLEEILNLYRRLHIELDDAGRSGLIVELFHDSRDAVRQLGFELADRDLSSNTVLAPEVGDAVKVMLGDPDAGIRSKAARLLARLVPPDAMIVLTAALGKETDSVAAEPMLMGISRWPNADAREAVMRWYLRDDSPLPAACAAVWSFEQAGLLNELQDRQRIIDRLRVVDPATLRESGMKLIARFGDASDLHVLVGLMLSGNPNTQLWAANALVETPRAVELLVRASEENPALFAAAADALIRHRATPEGLRRLAGLRAPQAQAKTDAIVRMGEAIDTERLTEAVHLADLSPELSITLLSRLVGSDEPLTPRSAKGVVMLAELQLEAMRPNRALEAVIALDKTGAEVESLDRAKADQIKATSLIMLGRLGEAYELSRSLPLWKAAIAKGVDAELRRRAVQFLLDQEGDSISEEQAADLRRMLLSEPGGGAG